MSHPESNLASGFGTCEVVRISTSTDPQATHRIFRNSVVVGADAGCDLSFDSPEVSPRHAEIYRVGDVWWLRDLNTRSGTYLEGEDIEVAPLGSTATVRLGECGPTIRLWCR